MWIACAIAFGVAGLGVPIAFLLDVQWKVVGSDADARRRMFKVAAVVGAISGGIALVAAAILGALTGNPYVAGGGGIVLAGALFLGLRAMAAQVRRVHGLALRLEDPKQREAARAEVLREVEAAQGGSTFPSIAIAAATVLANARLHEDALAVVERVERGKISGHELELWSLCRLSARLELRDLAGAQAALADVPEIKPGDTHHDVLRICRANLRTLEGDPAEALALLEAPATEPSTERSRQVALAHALAARGEHSRLHTLLREIHRRHGDAGLDRIVRPPGPASDEARTLLEERGPYGR